jgi:hypothetical protein
MTRGRSKRISNDQQPTNSNRKTSNSRRRSTEGTTSSTTSHANDKPLMISKVTLSDYVRAPSTRSRRISGHEGEDEEKMTGSSNSKRSRMTVTEKEGENEDEGSSDERYSSSEEEEVKDMEIKTEENGLKDSDESSPESSPEASARARSSLRNSARRSVRVPVKRVRYGFESEEEGEVDANQPTPKKMRKTLSYSMDKRKDTGKKPMKSSSVRSNRSSGRSRGAVNYCDYDSNEEEEDETEITNPPPERVTNGGVNSSTEEEVEVTDTSGSSSSSSSEAENEESNVPVSDVSSRGRVRRAATKFLDYS